MAYLDVPTEIISIIVTAIVSIVGSYLLFRGKKTESEKGMQEIASDSVQASLRLLEKRNEELTQELQKEKSVGGSTMGEKDALREEVMRLKMDIIAFASITKTIELSARQLPRLFRQLSPLEFEEYLGEHKRLIIYLIDEIMRDVVE